MSDPTVAESQIDSSPLLGSGVVVARAVVPEPSGSSAPTAMIIEDDDSAPQPSPTTTTMTAGTVAGPSPSRRISIPSRNRSPFRNSMLMRGSTTTTTTTAAADAPQTSSSDFSLALMPRDMIVKRTLHNWSVHHSVSTNNWVATIARPDSTGSDPKLRYAQFVFPTEREARKFCKAYAPPKMLNGDHCHLCNKPGVFRHCRNCGVNCCDAHSTRWGTRMLPKTYVDVPGSKVVRVCKACDWLSNAFCMSLLQARYEDSLQLFDTGNINLRTCFADIHREAMFPVHCAVIGGSLDSVKWLVERELCPISARVHPKTKIPLSVQTSACRTLLDLAMTGQRPKLDIMSFLIQQGLSIDDVKDPSLAPKALELILKSGALTKGTDDLLNIVEPSSGSMGDGGSVMTMTIEDACHICFEHPMDCVLTPCGHQVCCTECAAQMDRCPVCKVNCSYLRIYRQ